MPNSSEEIEQKLEELWTILNKSGVGMSVVKDNPPQPYTIWSSDRLFILSSQVHFEEIMRLDLANPVWIIDTNTELSAAASSLMTQIWNHVSSTFK